jgi:hypothetical protein
MKLDAEAKARMENEGGTSKLVPVSQPATFDSSPIIAIFRDRESAYHALSQLTEQMGIRNENIGLAFCDSSVVSAANDPSTYRATGAAEGEAEDSPLKDSFRKRARAPKIASPNTKTYDADREAKQYQSPPKDVMISIQPEMGEREKIRDLMIRCGAAA